MSLIAVAPGCEKSSAAPQEVRLVLAITPSTTERPAYAAAISRFTKKHPDIDVQVLEIPGNYYQKVLVMIAGDDSPDLMWMGQAVGEFVQRDTLLDITDRARRDPDLKEFSQAALRSYRIHDRQFGIPFGIDTQIIVYNRKLFTEAGLPFPKDDWTYDQFLESARKLTIDRDHDGKPEQYGFCGELDCSLFNASFISPDGRSATCNTPQMLRYLHTNLDLYNKYRVAICGKDAGEGTLDDNLTLFRQGRVAMMLMMTWDLPYIRQKLADMDWDITINPRVDRQAQWGSTQAIVISSRTKHPDQAWLLCREFFGDAFQRDMSRFTVPANLRTAREMLTDQARPANCAVLLRAVQSIVPDPRVPHLAELIQYFYDARESVWCGQNTPEQAMGRAQSQINHAIQQFEGGVR